MRFPGPRALLACVPLFGVAALGSCKGDSAGETSILLHLRVEAEALRPQYVLLTWRTPGGQFRPDLRVPETGDLPSTPGAILGSVLIQLDSGQPGERQIVARGMRADHRISGGMVRVPWRASQRQPIELTFVPWHDGDGDGVPDSPGEWPDGGVASDAGAAGEDAGPDAAVPADAAAPDLATEARPPEPDLAAVDVVPDTTDARVPAPDAAETPPNVAPAAGRLLYLRFDEMAGSMARDDSGNRNTATLVDFPAGRRTTGRYGGGLLCQGGSQGGWVRVDSSASVNAVRTAFTLAAWLHAPESGSASGTVLSRRASGPGGFIYALQLSSGRTRLRVNSANGYHADLSADTTLPRNRWIHVAATYDLTRVRLYLDGEPAGEMPYSHAVPDETSPLVVGGAESSPGTVGDRFAGRLDEVLLYSRALSPGEIEGLARSAALP